MSESPQPGVPLRPDPGYVETQGGKIAQDSIPGARPGEPALFNLVIKDTSGIVHLATRAKALCGRSMRQPKYVVSPSWWDERCSECFGKL